MAGIFNPNHNSTPSAYAYLSRRFIILLVSTLTSMPGMHRSKVSNCLSKIPTFPLTRQRDESGTDLYPLIHFW